MSPSHRTLVALLASIRKLARTTITCSPDFRVRRAQVTVYPSALAEDGSGAAASVAVSGGNRARLTDGAALLKDVRLTAEAPGTFCVTVASASRRVSGRHECLAPSV